MDAILKFIKSDLAFFLMMLLGLNLAHAIILDAPDNFEATRLYVFAALVTILRRLDRMEATP